MKKLPIGIQTFREIIEGGYLYADKTRFVYNLLTGVKCYFLSRPRRFGKSLLLDTIAEVFGGNRALFRGLWIDGTDYDFQNYPVIRLDMSTMTTKDADALEQSIMDRLCVLCKAEGIEIESSLLSSVFLGLIEGLHKKYGRRVAVLVDEYDKPVLDYILDTEIADANRQVIKNFFGVLKGMDAHLRFTFFTGVSKFTKTSLFSELNNLTDITLEDDFAAICGFTAQDITELFNEHLAALRAQKQFAQWPANGEGSVYDQIFKWYDGYSWDGETHVFNPFSLLQFFQNRRFSSYWYASGSPSFLIKLIKDNPAAYTDMDQAMINEDDLDATADLTRLSPVSLMFQTGYLTVKAIEWDSNGSADYYLKTPNREVRA
ncbi:MAG: AAA family ATPase, partial [Clostridiales bacterium]|nr:AAA family ATPase [Clostridiales bacterium]